MSVTDLGFRNYTHTTVMVIGHLVPKTGAYIMIQHARIIAETRERSDYLAIIVQVRIADFGLEVVDVFQ